MGINLPNIPEYLIAFAGALRAGCAVTGISPLLSSGEMEYQINDANADALVIMDVLFEKKLYKIKDKIPELKKIITAGVGDSLPPVKRILGSLLGKIPKGKIMPVPGKEVLTFKRLLKENRPMASQIKISPEETCLIQYTGGTTGTPKGTLLTHANMAADVDQICKWINFETGHDVLCSAFPLFHLAGLIFGMVAMATQNPQCLIPDPRNIKHICKEMAERRPTIIANVPTLYQMLLEEPAFKTLNFLGTRIFISGAAPFSVESINAMESVVGKGKVMEVYGMTETSPILTMNPFHGKKKIGSVGLPIQNTMVKLVDIETGTREVGFDEEGEIIASGPQIMKGYHNKPEETDNALREYEGLKYFYSGDIGKMDKDGYLYIVDRIKDMLIVSGYKVFSREVEEKLYQHPDIEFCAIVGVPDPKRSGNEMVKAVIQLLAASKKKDVKKLEQEIISFCQENMSPFKVPKIIEIVDEIPLTSVGKVDKKTLR
ncbi:Long-chain-fatty-acid--CoA ligase [subsurface metagenome]